MQPERIGRYEVLETLGRGGQAAVYRAYDTVMQREVALKVLPSTAAEDATARERFEREAHTIAALEHPAIVPVYDFGAYDDGLFIVMRLMKGGTLADRLKRGALNPEDTLEIIRRVAAALDAAHSRGIVHRDIKPANILFDEYGTAYLSDFGIARLNTAASSLTGSLIVGTPYYMSPEQINGGQIDGRSDVYALGAVLFQMLTGRIPYESTTPAQAILKHLQEPIPRLTTYRPDLPAVYQQIIERAMAKEPEARYPTAGALAADLEAAVRGRPLAMATTQAFTQPPSATMPTAVSVEAPTAVAPSQTTQVAPPPRRLAWPIAAAGLVAVVAVLAAGVMLLGRGHNGREAAHAPEATHSPAAPTTLTTIAGVVASPTPHALTATPSPMPTATASPTPPPPTETPLPSPTPTQSAFLTGGPVRGGTDLITMVVGGDIWAMTLDGKTKRLTNDGGHKHGLQWLTPNELLYISGKCVFTLSADDPSPSPLICFQNADTLDAFRVSPDGRRVAIVLDNHLFVTAFDVGTLAEYRDPALLPKMPGFCAYSVRERAHEVLWSQDSKLLAARVTAPLGNNTVGDEIEVLNPVCGEGIYIQHVFPGHRFPLTTYTQVPRIASFTWDGDKRFAFTLYWRNGSFGDMFFYSRATYQGEQLQPVQTSHCCYAVPQWSPDGTYLFFAFQDINDPRGKVFLYYVPAGTLGAGITYEPLPLKEVIFSAKRLYLEAALRPLPKAGP